MFFAPRAIFSGLSTPHMRSYTLLCHCEIWSRLLVISISMERRVQNAASSFSSVSNRLYTRDSSYKFTRKSKPTRMTVTLGYILPMGTTTRTSIIIGILYGASRVFDDQVLCSRYRFRLSSVTRDVDTLIEAALEMFFLTLESPSLP